MVDVSSLTIGLAKAVAPSAKGFLAKVGKEKYDKFVATYTNVFKDHLRATIGRCSSIKTLLHRDQPISLESQYVDLFLRIGDMEITDRDCVLESSSVGSASLISGLAGSGKSMFMKWAALRLIEKLPETQRIPLFVEVREVPRADLELPFDQIIFRMSSSDTSKATFEQFHVGLTEGLFIVMVDGLDEVPVKNRDSILNEITDFKRRFPKASLICSSRPDRQLENSNALSVYHVLAMTLDQIVGVIENALFDESKKRAFISALKDGLYERHESFLSNPLLATIMLITYDVGSAVPNKLSLFYSQAYEALFYKHDSSKGVYVREHHAHLDIDQFEAVFRTFCFQTYAMSKISFLASDLMDLIRTSIRQARVKADASDFLKDCKKSLCLLQEDGVYTSFVHRSFQEYFTAKFLSAYGGDEYHSLVSEVVGRSFSDSTFKMLYQIDPEDVLRRWGLPMARELLAELDALDLNDGEAVYKYMKTFAFAAYFDSTDYGGPMTFSWGHTDRIRYYHALNDALAASGLSCRTTISRGNIYKNSAPADAPPELLALIELDEDDPDDDDATTFGTPRYTVRLSFIDSDIILETGLPRFLEDLKASLQIVEAEIEKRLQSTDAFAKKVTRLFAGNSD